MQTKYLSGQPPYYWETPVYLYQWEGQNEQAALLDMSPSIDELFSVQWKMCSFIINNEFYIMGGENEYKQQQIKLNGCAFEEKIKQKKFVIRKLRSRILLILS